MCLMQVFEQMVGWLVSMCGQQKMYFLDLLFFQLKQIFLYGQLEMYICQLWYLFWLIRMMLFFLCLQIVLFGQDVMYVGFRQCLQRCGRYIMKVFLYLLQMFVWIWLKFLFLCCLVNLVLRIFFQFGFYLIFFMCCLEISECGCVIGWCLVLGVVCRCWQLKLNGLQQLLILGRFGLVKMFVSMWNLLLMCGWIELFVVCIQLFFYFFWFFYFFGQLILGLVLMLLNQVYFMFLWLVQMFLQVIEQVW